MFDRSMRRWARPVKVKTLKQSAGQPVITGGNRDLACGVQLLSAATRVRSMKRACAWVSLTALLSAGAFGQSAETAPKFEVSDIHSSPHITQPLMQGPFFAGSRYELRFA